MVEQVRDGTRPRRDARWGCRAMRLGPNPTSHPEGPNSCTNSCTNVSSLKRNILKCEGRCGLDVS